MCKVKDLQEHPISVEIDFSRNILFCRRCGGEYSANASDYFLNSPELELKCCAEPLELVYKKTTYEPVNPTISNRRRNLGKICRNKLK